MGQHGGSSGRDATRVAWEHWCLADVVKSEEQHRDTLKSYKRKNHIYSAIHEIRCKTRALRISQCERSGQWPFGCAVAWHCIGIPMPQPACGGQPYLNASMYASIFLSSILWAFARSVSSAESCTRWAPLTISSPRMNMSYELESPYEHMYT